MKVQRVRFKEVVRCGVEDISFAEHTKFLIEVDVASRTLKIKKDTTVPREAGAVMVPFENLCYWVPDEQPVKAK